MTATAPLEVTATPKSYRSPFAVTALSCIRKVLDGGKAGDHSNMDRSNVAPLSSTPSSGSGPVLGFSASVSQVRRWDGMEWG